MNKNIIVAFDVDGTLITPSDSGDIPRYEVIELFKKFESLGCSMVIWSGSGVNYAKLWSEN